MDDMGKDAVVAWRRTPYDIEEAWEQSTSLTDLAVRVALLVGV